MFPFFELNVGPTIYKFGNRTNQPRIMESRFEYTYSNSSTGVTKNVTLTENTIIAAIDSICNEEQNQQQNQQQWPESSNISWWWHVPPSVQFDMEDEGWTTEQIFALTIGDHLDLRITLEPIIETVQ